MASDVREDDHAAYDCSFDLGRKHPLHAGRHSDGRAIVNVVSEEQGVCM